MSIACTLTGDETADRVSLIEALARDGLLSRSATESGLRVELRDTPDIERRTRALIEAESRCCPFLDFALRRADGALVLDVGGPAEARPLLQAFFASDGTG